MQKYLLTIVYDGTDFCGWQLQPDQRTIQGEIQEALSDLYQKEIGLAGAGRTDTGVHALGQRGAFEAEPRIKTIEIPNALNARLPVDIFIKSCEEVNDSFHPRYDAKFKRYLYQIQFGKEPPVLNRSTHYYYRGLLNPKHFCDAVQKFQGQKDFKAFSCLRGDETGDEVTVRNIMEAIPVVGVQTASLELKGNGFLYKMVRMITGTVLKAAAGKIDISEIDGIFESRDSQNAGAAVPGNGLCLLEVGY